MERVGGRGRNTMGKSILDGKRILAVDDEPDVLEILHGGKIGTATVI